MCIVWSSSHEHGEYIATGVSRNTDSVTAGNRITGYCAHACECATVRGCMCACAYVRACAADCAHACACVSACAKDARTMTIKARHVCRSIVLPCAADYEEEDTSHADGVNAMGC